MPITIACASLSEFDAVDYIVDELQKSSTEGFEQVRDLVESFGGFKDDGLVALEKKTNSVLISYFATFTDRLGASVAVRRTPITVAVWPQEKPSQQKLTAFFRDVFGFVRSIQVFADNVHDAEAGIEKNGYGCADGMTLYPLKVERVELVLVA